MYEYAVGGLAAAVAADSTSWESLTCLVRLALGGTQVSRADDGELRRASAHC